MTPWKSTVLAMLLVVAPRAGQACSVCFSATDANRAAFILTTGFLTFLPLRLIGGLGWWVRRRYLEHERTAMAQPATSATDAQTALGAIPSPRVAPR